MIAFREVLDNSLPLLGFSCQTKEGEELPQCTVQRHLLKFKELQVLLGYSFAKF